MDELTALVARTEGPQPWRKLFHATNGVLIVAALTLVDPSERTTVLVLGVVTAALLAFDVVRLTAPRVNEVFFRLFQSLASPREMRGVASSTWYALGILVCALLFERAEVVTGVLVLGLADPAAAYVGRRWGKRPFLGGTVEGTVVFFVTCATIIALRHGVWVALPTALVACLAERRSWPLDDNFTIPLVCAGMITGIGMIP
ncbi:MAG: hypothetical protein PVJ80_09805 [Gemmatimonadota bacterium]|jgi:dolichol kinase